jgi:hypothetical protein
MDGPADTVEKIVELLNDKEKLAQYRYDIGGHWALRYMQVGVH